MVVDNVGPHRVKTVDGLCEILFSYLGAQQYVARVDAVAALFDQLYDMEAVLGLDDLRHFPWGR